LRGAQRRSNPEGHKARSGWLRRQEAPRNDGVFYS
jgi:hypothetical protein